MYKAQILSIFLMCFLINASFAGDWIKADPTQKSKNGEKIALEKYKPLLEEAGLELVKNKVTVDKEKIEHYRYQIKYKEYPFFGLQFIEHYQEGKLFLINGYTGRTKNNPPSFPKSKIVELESSLWKSFKDFKQLNKEQLVWYDPNYSNNIEQYKLCYQVELGNEQMGEHWIFFFDANTGLLSGKINLHEESDVVTNVNTMYYTAQDITCDLTGGQYELYESGRNIETYLMNAANPTDYGAATIPTSTTSNFSSLTGNEQVALDVHWSTELVYDYFWGEHGLMSFDGLGTTVKNYVGYGYNYVNAFWNGSVLSYGYGDLLAGYTPLACLDVVGHEYTHGVIDNSPANLIYSHESGAINEAYADIFGLIVEYKNQSNPAITFNWTLGELVNGTGLRSLSNPESFNQPRYYTGPYWHPLTNPTDNFGVHTNSGVINHWFYLLVDGGSGTNPVNGYNYTIDPLSTYLTSGTSVDALEDLIYCSLSYMPSNATFTDAKQAILNCAAAQGLSATAIDELNQAFWAVGIDDTATTGSFQFSLNKDAPRIQPCPGDNNEFVLYATAPGLNYTIYWGDGSNTSFTGASPFTYLNHTYGNVGQYTIEIYANNPFSGAIEYKTLDFYVIECNGPLDDLTRSNMRYGDRHSINFLTGHGVAELNSNPSETFEGSVTVNNPLSGALEFSVGAGSGGWGVEPYAVYDASGTAIIDTIPGSGGSALQGVVVVKHPSQDIYNIFTTGLTTNVSVIDPADNGFKRTIIHKTPGGWVVDSLAAFISSTVTSQDCANGGALSREYITSIPSCNEMIHWILIINQSVFDKKVLIYKLDFTTHSLGEVTLQSTFSNFTYPGGWLVANKEGDKVLIKGSSTYDFLDFDKVNGTASLSSTSIPTPPSTGFSRGAEFSDNGRFLYIAGGSFNNNTIFRLDLDNISSGYDSLITNDFILSYNYIQDVERGPDGRIYASCYNSNNNWGGHLVINEPNEVNCQFNPNVFMLDNDLYSGSLDYLPNFVDAASPQSAPLDFTFNSDTCNAGQFEYPYCKSYYLWNFGDGTTSTLQNPYHVFPGPGVYQVSLQTHYYGVDSVHTQTVTVGYDSSMLYIDGEDIVDCSSSLSQYYQAPNGHSNYSWTITGGTINTPSVGDHQVLVTWDPLASAHFITANYEINNCPVSVTLDIDLGAATILNVSSDTLCVGDYFCVEMNGSAYFTEVIINGSGTTITPSHFIPNEAPIWCMGIDTADIGTIWSSGWNEICFVTEITSGVCVDTICFEFYLDSCVLLPCEASFTYEIKCDREVVFLANNPSSSVSHTWHFGDGSTSSSSNPIHTYLNDNNYTITHITDDGIGCMDTMVQTIEIADFAISTVSIDTACIEDTVCFNIVGAGTLTGYEINGNSSVVFPSPLTINAGGLEWCLPLEGSGLGSFYSLGVNSICFFVTSSEGTCIDTICATFYLEQCCDNLGINFDILSNVVCLNVGDSLSFSLTGSGVINNTGINGNFGPGGMDIPISSFPNPSNIPINSSTFAPPLVYGVNEICMVVSESILQLCVDTLCGTFIIDSCIACVNDTTELTIISCDSVEYNGTWYTSNTDVEEVLTSTDGCDSIVITHIEISTHNIIFSTSTDSLCEEDTICTQLTGNGYIAAISVNWYNYTYPSYIPITGGGINWCTPVSMALSPGFWNWGLNEICFAVVSSDSACIDTLCQIFYLDSCNTPCTVDPTFDWSFGCPDIKVVPNEGDPTATHIWDFGDGTITSSTGGGIVYHTYTSNGTYTVTHIINLGWLYRHC